MLRRKAGAFARWAATSIALVIGFDELVLGAGLVLITVALWPDFGIRALIVPGLVGVWISLPTRTAFVHPPQEPKKGS